MADDVKSRYAKLMRVASLISESGERGCSIYEIMKAIGARNRSSAFNVIDTLESMGFSLYTDKSSENPRMTVYKIDPDSATSWKRRIISDVLSSDDVRFLNFIFETVSSNTPLMNISGKDFLKRMGRIISPDTSKESFSPQMRESGSYYDIGPEYFQTLLLLLEAVEKRIRCHIQYESRNSETTVEYDIYPLKVIAIEGSVYAFILNAYGDFQLLALQRIKRITKGMKTEYPMPKESLEEREADPFPFYQTEEKTTVQVRIDGYQAWYEIQKAWPSGVSFSENDDGSYTFTITTRSIYGLLKWILSMGDSATIISPESVKNRMQKMLEDMLSLY